MTARRWLVTLTLLLAANAAALGSAREEARLLQATQVLEETQAMPDGAIPDWLLQRAQGIAILPAVVKVALIFPGGRGGAGVLTVRDAQGRWTNPVFVTLLGGSFGWQAGVQVSDLILVFTTRRSVEGLSGGKVTLGADASVAVGPVGRQVSGATDIGGAEVYSYSRSKGLFGGIAIDGTAIAMNNKANAAYYQRGGALASEIMASDAPAAPASAQRLLDTLRRLPHGGDGTTIATGPAQPAATAATPANEAPPDGHGLESGNATTYPLNDGKPHP